MPRYDFSVQQQLFEIAYQILEDYNITNWSFGGGTALSYCYYQHRMSYDIDIFIDEFSAISLLLEYKEEIANNLGIPLSLVKSSTNHLTFILKENEEGLKLDFLYGRALTSNPYEFQDVFSVPNIKVQTPIEILARKLKHRETLTIRDFVDFAFVEQEDEVLTKLKSENIVDIDRFFDVLEQFNSFNTLAFNQELKHLNSSIYEKKEGLSKIINALMLPNNIIKVAFDEVEVVAFDHFIDSYRTFYEEIGSYGVVEIKKEKLMKFLGKDFITYEDVLGLEVKDVEYIMDFLYDFRDEQGLINTKDIQLVDGNMYIKEQEVASLDEINELTKFLKNNPNLWSISKISLQLKRKGNRGGARAPIIGVPFSEGLKNVIEGKRVEKSMFYIDKDLTGKGLEGRLFAHYNRREFEIDFQLWETIPHLPTYYIHGIYDLKKKIFSHFDGALIDIDEEAKEDMKWNFTLPSKEYPYRKLFRLDGNISIEDVRALMYFYLPLEDLNREYGVYPSIKEKNEW